MEGTLPFTGDPSRLPLAFSPDDTILYQINADIYGLSVILSKTANLTPLATIYVRSPDLFTYTSDITTDASGSYLFVANTPNVTVYDVSPQLTAATDLLALRGSSFS